MNPVPQRQTKTWQRKLIDGAKHQGKLCDLYWFVNAYIPARYYSDRQARVQPAMFPKIFVPVIRMTPDEVESRHHADVLGEIFGLVNRGRGFDTAKTPFGELFIKRGSDDIYQLSHYHGNMDKKIGWSDNFDEIKEEAEKYWQAKVRECLQDD